MSYSRETIKIPSKDPNVLLDVWLFTPTSSPKPHPVVVAGHGLTLTKDAGYEALCERWASDAGFASLVLDYRGFGASGGTPRNVLSPAMQTEDYKAVIAWARKHPEPFRLDKIVVMGSAMSGLSVAQLAVEDQKLAGAIAQCPVLDGFATIMAMAPNPALVFWATVDVLRRAIGLSPMFVRAVGKENEFAFLKTPSSYKGFTDINAQSSTPFSERPNLLNASAVYSVMGARPGLQLSKAACPVLIVMAENDDIIAEHITRDICAKAGKHVQLIVSPGCHYDVIKGGVGFDTNIKAQISFLKGLM